MQVVLLRVGIDTGSGGIHGPLFSDGSFEYIPIPDSFRGRGADKRTYGNTSGRQGRRLVDYFPEARRENDASAIIPAKDIFLEGRGSGSHAGSVGAFSDLFRYQLLSKRGGMWTDTDVINFKKFDPDGQRFISTELTDAGLITLNGAIMAAPAGDEMVVRGYERARAILSSNGKMFFTRIGPYLLAEVALELGVDKIELMPPSFLSPVSWMNTASLLQPFDVAMARQEFRQAINIHVYTEMWRTLGLGLDQPPSDETFLGRLYADHFGEQNTAEADSTQKVVSA